jgi:hypothetical protein
MAKTSKLTDQYPQTVTIHALEAVAGNGFIVQVPSSYSMRDRVGMELIGWDVAPYGPGAWAAQLAADGDYAGFGLSHLFRGGTIPAIEEPTGMIDLDLLYREYLSVTAAGIHIENVQPYMRHVFPQPIIAHPASVWVWGIMFTGSAALDIIIKVHYRLIDINDAQWQELFESILIRDTI